MSTGNPERGIGIRELSEAWLEELEAIERQRAGHAAEGMKLLHEQAKIIWNRGKRRLESSGRRFNPHQPLVAKVDLPHAAVHREIVAILSPDNSNNHGLRLVQATRECEVKIFNPDLALRLQFEINGRRFEIHNMDPKQPARPPKIDVWPLPTDSIEGKLADPTHLLSKVIRALPHIVALKYDQKSRI